MKKRRSPMGGTPSQPQSPLLTAAQYFSARLDANPHYGKPEPVSDDAYLHLLVAKCAIDDVMIEMEESKRAQFAQHVGEKTMLDITQSRHGISSCFNPAVMMLNVARGRPQVEWDSSYWKYLMRACFAIHEYYRPK